jgi:HSP20 family molecular chaperone IbpA
MAKRYVLKKDLDITFTPEEIWELIVICEGAKSFCKDAMSQYQKGSGAYNEYKESFETAERMQKKLVELRNTNGVLEEI